jgi:integrase/recombinase XerD
LAVMLTTGARTTEVLAVDVADLGATGGHRVLKVTRKGGKRQSLPLVPWVGELVDAYLAGRTDGPLFATTARDGGYGRMDEPSLLRLVRRTGAAAGLENAEQLHPHSLRHSAITGALEAGGTLRDVQAMAGHADPRTTERYDRMRGRLDKSPIYLLGAALAED